MSMCERARAADRWHALQQLGAFPRCSWPGLGCHAAAGMRLAVCCLCTFHRRRTCVSVQPCSCVRGGGSRRRLMGGRVHTRHPAKHAAVADRARAQAAGALAGAAPGDFRQQCRQRKVQRRAAWRHAPACRWCWPRAHEGKAQRQRRSRREVRQLTMQRNPLRRLSIPAATPVPYHCLIFSPLQQDTRVQRVHHRFTARGHCPGPAWPSPRGAREQGWRSVRSR